MMMQVTTTAPTIEASAVTERLEREFGPGWSDRAGLWLRWRLTGRRSATVQLSLVVRADPAGIAEAWILDLGAPGVETDVHRRIATADDLERLVGEVRRRRSRHGMLEMTAA